MDCKSLSHCRWKCQYHIVFIPKYRQKVLYGQVKADVREILKKLCEYKKVEIIEGIPLEVVVDDLAKEHIHILNDKMRYNMLISVVIPVYNTPPKLFKRCINSIENSENVEVEIIVVNDGSTEDLTKAYINLCNQYKNIKYIFQNNSGVSKSRNVGVNTSNGDYVVFVDADDVIENDFIKRISVHAAETMADIIIGKIDFDGMFDKQKILKSYYFEGDEIIRTERALLVGVYEKNGLVISGSPCGRAYRRSLVKDYEFNESVGYFEDQLYNIRVFHAAHSILVVPETWYKYCRNDFSAMHKGIKSNYAMKSIPFFDELFKITNDINYKRIQTELMIFGLNFLYNSLEHLYDGDISNEEYFTTKKQLRNCNMAQLIVKKFGLSSAPNLKVKLKLILLKNDVLLKQYFIIRKWIIGNSISE